MSVQAPQETTLISTACAQPDLDKHVEDLDKMAKGNKNLHLTIFPEYLAVWRRFGTRKSAEQS